MPPLFAAQTVIVALGATCAIFLAFRIVSTTLASWLLVPIVAFCLSLSISALAVLLLPFDAPRRLVLYSAMLLGFFVLLLSLEGHAAYLQEGMLHFAHGRYLYAAFGFIVSGLILPAMLALGRFAPRAALPAAIILCTTDAAFFLTVTLPYAAGY